MIYQFFALVLIIGIVYAIAYRRGKTSKEREFIEVEEQELTPNEEEKMRKFYKFFKLFDQLMTDDDFFSDDIAESSKTDTNKGVNKE